MRHKEQLSAYAVMPATIVSTRNLTDLEKYFEIGLEGGRELGHAPGQFVMISVPGVGEAPISVSSPPERKRTFELVIRRAGMVTTSLHSLKVGDTVGIRGPMGKGFPVKELEHKDIVFIGGGCGNIPLRSMIWHAARHPGRFGKITVLSACKTPETFLFLDELEALRREPGVVVDVTVTVDRGNAEWKRKVGLITTLIPDLNIDPARTYALVVGPPIMYKYVIQELLKKDLADDHIILSLERNMKCGVGKCGHCQIGGLYCCQDGPVFTYKEISHNIEAI